MSKAQNVDKELTPEGFLTEREVAERLKVSVRAVVNYRTRASNPIPFFKLPSGAIRFRWASVEAWVEGREIQRGA